MKIFNLPDLGEGLPDAEIVEWHVKEGDVVKEDQPMVSMETAKAVVDVPCPFSGRITKLHGNPGDVIDTGAPLVEFDGEGSEPAAYSSETTNVKEEASKLKEEINELIDELDSDDTFPKSKAEVSSGNDSGTVVGEMESSDEVVSDISTVGNVKIAPAVKALAKKLKVDLNDVVATGAGGVIRPSDIRLAHEQGSTTAKSTPAPVSESKVSEPKTVAPAPAKPQPPAPIQKVEVTGEWKQVKGTRRTMARIMADSHAQIVPTTIMDDADIYKWSPGEDITARLIRAIVAGVEAEPALNSWFDGEKLARRLISHVDIGIAVDTPDGLFVPTMRNCEK
ncbi:MAG: 2-oxo acid dehydrogenase subunit E2, partial [Xanthomonadales bacterium]|nr:2-oxo acid dehydrogenase subunit E2 [Xanthomonadales bacterium]